MKFQMRNNKEIAKGALTLQPCQRFTLPENGFTGCLYRPEENLYIDKVIIMCGGSDGSFSLTCLIAEQFVKRGLTVLALAYWSMPGLPGALEKRPVEYIEKAALWLQASGYLKIGLWGISKGSEYCLISASLLPELISCVIAVSLLNMHELSSFYPII